MAVALFGMILFLLKCIGILLLAIVGIILLVILTVLFSPIRYKAKGEKTDTLCGDFQIKWIFGFVAVSGAWQQGQQNPILDIRIFGKSLTQDKKQKKRKKKKQPDILYTREAQKPNTQTPPKAVTQPDKSQAQQPQIKETQPEIQQPEIPKQQPPQKKEGIRRVKLEQIQETPPPEIPKQKTEKQKEPHIYDDQNSTKADADDIGIKWKTICKMALAYDQKKALAKATWQFVKALTKTILPNQLYFKGTFGTGDPALTGYLLAMTGILKGKFGENLDIKGDFAKATAENIVFRLKGHIVLGHLAYLAARFALSKPVRHIIKALWKGRKRNG